MTEDEKKEFEEFLEWKKMKSQQRMQGADDIEQERKPQEKEVVTKAAVDAELSNKKSEPEPSYEVITGKQAIAIVLIGVGVILLIAVLLMTCSGHSNSGAAPAVDSAYSETANADSMAAAQQEEHLADVCSSVNITSAYLSAPNSAGGVDAIVRYINISSKTIKYFQWRGKAINAVGDVVESEIGLRTSFGGKDTGPIEPHQSGGGTWDCVIYNNTAKKLILTEVTITYMDGTVLRVPQEEIKYLK